MFGRMSRARHLAAIVSAALGLSGIACGVDPIGRPTRCVGTCVPFVESVTDHLVLTPGDTGRMSARARTADGDPVAIRWRAGNERVAVDAGGLVTALAPGRAWVYAIAAVDSSKAIVPEVWIVDPDTSAQPFITLFRDAATGDTLLRRRGFVGRDSIDVTVSYVLGRSTQTPGAPVALFQLRASGAVAPLTSTSVPLTQRGRAASFTVRVRLTERDANGARRFPPGFYDLFVLLPLADGRQLGDRTGYPVQF